MRAINHVVQHPSSMLWIDTGLGKTVVAETAFAHLQAHNYVRAALVLGPLRVVQSVWHAEAAKWEQLKHLRFSLIHGNSAQDRMRGLTRPADIYLMNYENLPWLLVQLKHYYIDRGTLLPFDFLIADEIPKLKNYETKRMEAIIPMLPFFKYRTGLTGTPSSNGLEDLFGQYLVLDNGARLGMNYGMYLSNYFKKADQNGYKYEATPEGASYIYRQVSDITLNLRAADYLELPKTVINDIYVDMPRKYRKQYEELEMLMFTELENGAILEVNDPGARTNKCLQFSNGAVYTDTETKAWEPVHDLKLDALEDIVEEAGGEPILVAYNYKPDAKRIMARFPYAKNLTGMSRDEFLQTLADWNEGKIRLLLGHPASMGHGVDGLQKRGHICVWFGLNWSLEYYMQLNARLDRQGQERSVIIHRIMCRGTADELVRDSLEIKGETQEGLRSAVDLYQSALSTNDQAAIAAAQEEYRRKMELQEMQGPKLQEALERYKQSKHYMKRAR